MEFKIFTNNKLKQLSLATLLLGAGTLFTSSCAIGSISDRITESIGFSDPILLTTKSYPISSIRQVNVSTSGGSLSVTGDAAQEVVLEMYVNPNNNRNLSKEEIQEILDRDYEISIQQNGGTLEAIAKRKSNLNWKNAISISFKIRTGKQVETNLSTSGGSIKLAGLSGNQDFRTSGGSLSVSNIDGDMVGETSGGSIHVDNSEGDIDLSTSGGSINFDHLNGDIQLSTSGGSIKGQTVRGSLRAETSGGSIRLEDLACKVKASTSGGSVSAVFSGLPGDVALSTSAGSVNVTLPSDAAANLDLKGQRVNAGNLSNFNGTNKEGRLTGSINGGGVNVQASTSAGNVNLSFQ